jgi:hypothetical protein
MQAPIPPGCVVLITGYGDRTIEALDDLLRASPRIGLWLDTCDHTPRNGGRDPAPRARGEARPVTLRSPAEGDARWGPID